MGSIDKEQGSARSPESYALDIMDRLPDAICCFTPDYRISYANASYIKRFGLNKEKLNTYSYLDIFDQYQRERMIRELKVLQPEHTQFDSFCRVKIFSGEETLLWCTILAFFNKQGQVLEYQFTGRNLNQITGEFSTEQRYQALFHSMEEGFLLCEVILNDRDEPIDYILLDANRAIEKATGYDKKDYVGQSILFLDPGAEELWLDECTKAALSRKANIFRYYDPYRDRYFEVMVFSPQKGQFAAIFVDVSDTVHAEEQMKGQLQFMQTLIEIIPNPVFYKDMNGRYFNCNQAFENYLGLPKEQVIGQVVGDVISTESSQLFAELDNRLLRKGHGTLITECTYIHPNGSMRDLIINKGLFYDVSGTPAGIVGVFTDITEQKRMEKQIARLEQLNIVGEIAAGIGHEIRNPMTTVRGFLQMLQEDCSVCGYKTYFDLMIEETDRANAIITEFLTLAKDRPLQKQSQNLNDVIRALQLIIEAEARKGDHYVEYELNEVPDFSMDGQQIRQIILNLVQNGLESMCARGKLLIRTEAIEDQVVLSICDEGEGILPEVMARLGQPFVTSKENGTGLGLAVCYSIASKHGASIDVNTGPRGTTFSVYFPI